MIGSVYLMKDRGQWHVSWPWADPKSGKKKTFKITDHARLDSVKRYAKTEVARKRELMNNKDKMAGLLRLVHGGK